MSEKWTDKAWVQDLRLRLTRLVGLSSIVGVAVVGLIAAGLLGSQGGGEGIEDALLLEPPRAAGTAGFDVGPHEQRLAPDFEISDFNGVRHRLSDFRGKTVYVSFWASWCGPCKRELPDIQELQKRHPDDLVVIAVNRGEPLARAEGFFEELTRADGGKGVSFPVNGMDPDDTLYDAYRGLGMPVSVFIDPDGVVTSAHNGLILLEQMEEAVAASLA